VNTGGGEHKAWILARQREGGAGICDGRADRDNRATSGGTRFLNDTRPIRVERRIGQVSMTVDEVQFTP